MKILLSLIIFLFLGTGTVFTQGKWQKITSPVSTALYKVQFLDSLVGYAAGDSGVIIKTTNAGQNWKVQNSGINTPIYDLFFLNENVGWGVTWRLTPPYGSDIVKTLNGGDTWFVIEYPEEDVFLRAIVFLDSLTGYIGGEGGNLKKTNDGGFTWRECAVQEEYSGFPILNFSLTDDSLGFASGGHVDVLGIIWRTTDAGGYWTTKAVSPEPIYSIHMIDSLNAIGMGGDWEWGTMVVTTTNAGETWNYRPLDIYGIAHKLVFRTKHDLWVALGAGQVLLHTNDSAKTFHDTLRVWDIVPNPGNVMIFDLSFPDSLHGFGVGDSGAIISYVYMEPLDVRDENPLLLPDIYEPPVNYPNPFNPFTTITWYAPQAGSLRLNIYTPAGEHISALHNGIVAAGAHSFLFDASRYPSGVYLYRLEYRSAVNPQKNIVQSGKMVYLK